jgi:hypothetical protein
MLLKSLDDAYSILEKYFNLFVEKQKKDGYQLQILLDEHEISKNKTHADYFYVRFWKENAGSRIYKIDC